MKDSSHFYTIDGESRWEVPNKSKPGEWRKTTLRDAKANDWLPSPTTVAKVLSKPELDNWKFKQIIHSSLTLPRKPEETDDQYCDRIIEDAFEQVVDAADIGTQVHKAIENHFQGIAYDSAMSGYVELVEKWVERHKVTFLKHETRIVDVELGVCGTTDALITMEGRDGIGVLDIKTRKTKADKKVTPYTTEPLQIAFYAHPVGAVYGVNLYLSTTEPGRCEEAFYDRSRLKEEYQAFGHVVALYRHINNFPYNNK